MDGDYLRLFADKYGLDMETASEFAPYVTFVRTPVDTVVIDSRSADRSKEDPYFFILEGQAFARVRTEYGLKYLFILKHPRVLLNSEIPDCEYGAYSGALLMRIDYQDLLELTINNKTIQLWLFELYREGVCFLVERISSLLLKSAKERLIEYLDQQGIPDSSVKKRHIADFLGIAPGSLSRLLGSKANK